MLTLPISAAVFVALSACAGVARFLNLQGSIHSLRTSAGWDQVTPHWSCPEERGECKTAPTR